MSSLVFIEPNSLDAVPFTTSKLIAEHGKVKHRTVTKLIQTYEEDLTEFGRVRFKIDTLQTKGGPQETKYYYLNEEQATLLITYMKNTLPVRKFKKTLVKQFYLMQKELNRRAITREIAKEAREALTNAIKELPETPHKAMKYKHYTDLVYKIVFKKNTKQLREQFGISKKDILRNYFTAEQIIQIEKAEKQISVLIDLGNDYQTIKRILENKYLMTA